MIIEDTANALKYSSPTINFHLGNNGKSLLINAVANCILPLIPDNSVDLVFTDPPYDINYAEWDKFLQDVEFVSEQYYRILKPTGSVILFAGWSSVCSVIQKFDKRFKLNDWIIYDRIKGRGAKKRLVSTREDILWYVKGENWIFNKDFAYSTIIKKTKGMGAKNGRKTRALSNVWTDISPIVPWSKERYKHPTQKPLQIAKRIMQVFSNPGNVVVDSYAGTGTFGVEALLQGNYFIGIEKEKNFFDICIDRISDKT